MIIIPIMGSITQEEYNLIRKANEIELRERDKNKENWYLIDSIFLYADLNNLKTVSDSK